MSPVFRGYLPHPDNNPDRSEFPKIFVSVRKNFLTRLVRIDFSASSHVRPRPASALQSPGGARMGEQIGGGTAVAGRLRCLPGPNPAYPCPGRGAATEREPSAGPQTYPPQLEAARNPCHRKALEDALADLEARLSPPGLTLLSDSPCNVLTYNGLALMKAYVYVSLKKSVLDPQGKTIQGALKKLGYQGWKTSARVSFSNLR